MTRVEETTYGTPIVATSEARGEIRADASLSAGELGSLIESFLRHPIPRPMVAALHRLVETESHALVTIVRHLLDDESQAFAALQALASGRAREPRLRAVRAIRLPPEG